MIYRFFEAHLDTSPISCYKGFHLAVLNLIFGLLVEKNKACQNLVCSSLILLMLYPKL